jgi:archaemetzincin
MNPGRIVLAPIGAVPKDLLRWLANRLAEVLDADTAIGEQIALPEAGYDPKRDQFASGAMLNALRARVYPEADRLLGLADVDCYVPSLNFVFGQAALRSGPAFVALPRLRPSFYGLPEDPDLFRQRVLKEAVHELGHTWGLEHCKNPSCVMHFSNRLRDTDRKGAEYCPRCQRLLEQS